MDPNTWTPLELTAISASGIVYFAGLTLAIRQGLRADKHRLYWRLCAASMFLGAIGMVFAKPTDPVSGELPEEFGLGVWMVLLGLTGIVAKTVWALCVKAIRVLEKRG